MTILNGGECNCPVDAARPTYFYWPGVAECAKVTFSLITNQRSGGVDVDNTVGARGSQQEDQGPRP